MNPLFTIAPGLTWLISYDLVVDKYFKQRQVCHHSPDSDGKWIPPLCMEPVFQQATVYNQLYKRNEQQWFYENNTPGNKPLTLRILGIPCRW